MSGTIFQIDGPAGCGKSTVLCGMPEPRALLDTDVDGARWLRQHFAFYETTRSMLDARRVLSVWADNKEIASVAVDVWAYFWQTVAQQVMDDDARKREFATSNMYKAWGPAKMAVRRLYDPLLRAKRAGKHICLTAHTKEATEQRDDKTVVKLGLRADTEAMLNDILDVHLRMYIDFKKDTRWFETVKCRPQQDFKPLLPARIDVPLYESHLMYQRVLALIGEAPESLAAGDAQAEDEAAVTAMADAAKGAKR